MDWKEYIIEHENVIEEYSVSWSSDSQYIAVWCHNKDTNCIKI